MTAREITEKMEVYRKAQGIQYIDISRRTYIAKGTYQEMIRRGSGQLYTACKAAEALGLEIIIRKKKVG